jgi:hypothetical protein
MNIDLKRICLIAICWILTISNSVAATNGNLIFPLIPSRLTSVPPPTPVLFETGSKMTDSNNVIFIGSEFCFAIPSNSDLNQIINSDQSSSIKIKITDSSNQEFELTPEVIKPRGKNILVLIKSEALSTDAVEGNGTIDIILNNESLKQDKVFISKTLASKLGIPSSLATKVNNVILLNRVNKDNLNRITALIGGNNFYKKNLPYNDTILKKSRGLTHASLFPRNEFTSITSRVLKGNEVLRLKSHIKKKRFDNDIFVLVASPFGLEIKTLSISKCNGKVCGEN